MAQNTYKGLLIGIGVLIVIVGGFFWLNSYIYEEKQGEIPEIIGENLEGEADPSRMTLGMTEWRWIRTEYNDGREVRPKREGDFTLTFSDDGSVAVKTDCNHMGGKYEARAGTITFSDMFTTLMYCEGSQEAEFSRMLGDAAMYHFTSRGELILDLKFDSGSVTFR